MSGHRILEVFDSVNMTVINIIQYVVMLSMHFKLSLMKFIH